LGRERVGRGVVCVPHGAIKPARESTPFRLGL